MKFLVNVDYSHDEIEITACKLDKDHNPTGDVLFHKIIDGDQSEIEMKLMDVLKDEVSDEIYDAVVFADDDRIKLN